MVARTQAIPQEKAKEATTPAPLPERTFPDATGLSPAEYAYEAMRHHEQQYKGQGTPPPGILKWFGDAALAVAPINRIACAIGLTSGLMAGGTIAKIATGYGLDGKAVTLEQVPTFLQKLHKVVKNYNPAGLDSRNRWIKAGQWGFYSLGGLIGVKMGTDYAYRNVAKTNKDPHYLEDYLARVSMHQGNQWSWLAAGSAVFGSASGLFYAPIPGLNYGVSLAGRSASMQDRNFMIKGMNEMLSGAATPSYLRLREGTHYLCHYAAANPAQTPTQIEYLAFTLLGPIFKDQLKTEHLQQFTDAVLNVRDRFWQPGGIPKEKRAEAVAMMKEVFTGAGLEVLLIDMGLNPGTVAFEKLNGLTGKIGNISGAIGKVRQDQAAFLKAMQERLPSYVADGEISQAQAGWVVAGINAMKEGKPLPPAPEEPEASSASPEAKGKDTAPEMIPDTAAERPQRIEAKPHLRKTRQSIERLIETSGEPGDWRERALRQKQEMRDVPLVE